MVFIASYNDSMRDNIFQLQRTIAEKLLDLLEDELISIERAAEIATEVLNIVGEDAAESALSDIKQQLVVIPELKTLNVLNF